MRLFSATLFVSAALAFVVEPLIARRVLPALGGSASVWTTCLLFFQCALLAGYALAHLLSRWTPRVQVVTHLGLLLLALMALLATPSTIPPPAGDTWPTLWLLGALVLQVGLPFVALSVNSTLLQGWFSIVRPGVDPYGLYRASNLGSLVGLLAYPFAIEPLLRLGAQSGWWIAGFCGLIALVGACARTLWTAALPSDASPAASREASARAAGPDWRRRGHWALIAFVPSSLTLGVTTYLSTDLAAVPLLWVVPLALYLLSFALTFGHRQVITARAAARVFPVALAAALLAFFGLGGHSLLVFPLHLAALLACGLLAHGRLWSERPDPAHLTDFYLWVAVGGVLGGVFNAVVAPHVFDTLAEYPLVLALAALVLPLPGPPAPWRVRATDAAIGTCAGLLALGAAAWARGASLSEGELVLAVFGGPALLLVLFGANRRRFAAAACATLLAAIVIVPNQSGMALHEARSFFGTLRVTSEQGGIFHTLRHGTTVHGRQDRRGGRKRLPLSYYHPSSPIGQLMTALRRQERPLQVGVVGLGTGTMAAYSRPGDHWVFYEIDSEVVRIARTGAWFSYLEDARPTPSIVLGDARVSLAREAPRGFDLIVLDAFSSDAIPIHLITREAFDLYKRHLAAGGVIAVHVSNRHLVLAPVVARIAEAVGWRAILQVQATTPSAAREGISTSRWLVVAPPDRFESLGLRGPAWRAEVGDGQAPWTDDYSNLVSVIHWQ